MYMYSIDDRVSMFFICHVVFMNVYVRQTIISILPFRLNRTRRFYSAFKGKLYSTRQCDIDVSDKRLITFYVTV